MQAAQDAANPLKFCVMILYRRGGPSTSGLKEISLRYHISSMDALTLSLEACSAEMPCVELEVCSSMFEFGRAV